MSSNIRRTRINVGTLSPSLILGADQEKIDAEGVGWGGVGGIHARQTHGANAKKKILVDAAK